jgi:hypothetical protein
MSQLREINIPNIIDFFNLYNISDFKHSEYIQLSNKIFDYCKLYEKGEIYFSIDKLGPIYVYCVKKFDQIYNHCDISNESKIVFRFFINFIFGTSYNKFKPFGISKPEKVIEYFRSFYENISNYEWFIYNDVDGIYCEQNEHIEDLINKCIGLDYEKEDNFYAYFEVKKKYITLSDDGIKTKGFEPKRIGNEYRTNTYKKLMDAFEELKSIQRYKKIDKIKENFVITNK